jgi:hypothetical protein
MGSEPENARRPRPSTLGLAERLGRISPNPPVDPKALASIIDDVCGPDIDFNLYRYDGGLPDLRKATNARLRAVKKAVAKLYALGNVSDDVDPFTLVLSELAAEHARDRAAVIVPGLISALQTVHDFPMDARSRRGRGRPTASLRVSNIIAALRQYLEAVEDRRFTVNIEVGAGKGGEPTFVFKSRAAHLARQVLNVLEIDVSDTHLKTLLEKARRTKTAIK